MRLNDQDAAYLYAETASAPMHGATFSVIEGRLSLQSIRDHVSARIHLIPRLRQRLVYVPFNLAHPVWADDPDFAIEKHIKSFRIKSGTGLEHAVAEGAEQLRWLLPRNQPLWRMIVIEGVRNKTILLQAVHHAIADDAAGLDLSPVLFDLKARVTPAEQPASAWSPPRTPSSLDLVRNAVSDSIPRIRKLARALPDPDAEPPVKLSETLRRAGESLTRFVAQPIVSAPWNASAVGPKRRLVWHRVPLAEVRQIRRALGGSINDVVLAVITEAAARYLQKQKSVVKGKHLRLMCPVSVRTDDEQTAETNRVSGIFPITSAESMDMHARFTQIRLETEQLKHAKEAHALDTLRETLPSVPALVMAPTRLVGTALDPTALAATFPLPVASPFGMRPPVALNFTCTTIPGVQTAQFLAGHEVLDTLSMPVLGANLGYGVAVNSYNQKLYFNFVAEPRLMPDPELMANLVGECFQELLACGQKTQQQAG